MFSELTRLFRKGAALGPPKPDGPICIVGDIHGCLAQLQALLLQVPQEAEIILVGDYIDRGEQSAEVLRMLQSRPDLLCLMGNHEHMLLRFLSDPVKNGRQWLRNGGLQTLASFRVPQGRPEMAPDDLLACRDTLRQAMGDVLIDWVANLKTSYQSGNVFVSHAGADPALPPDKQSKHDLLWGNARFMSKARRDGLWVVHGHTIVDAAGARDGRIAVDTGAFATGTLSAICLDGGDLRVITAQA